MNTPLQPNPVEEASMNIPDRVIIYDGQCFLCNQWLHFLPPRDPERRYCFCPLQTATGRQLMRMHGLDPDNPSSFLYLEQGQPYVGTEAIIRAVSGLGGRWRTVALLRVVPRVLRDVVYAVIVRNRYRWFGGSPTCVMPSADLRRRFLEWPTTLPLPTTADAVGTMRPTIGEPG